MNWLSIFTKASTRATHHVSLYLQDIIFMQLHKLSATTTFLSPMQTECVISSLE